MFVRVNYNITATLIVMFLNHRIPTDVATQTIEVIAVVLRIIITATAKTVTLTEITKITTKITTRILTVQLLLRCQRRRTLMYPSSAVTDGQPPASSHQKYTTTGDASPNSQSLLHNPTMISVITGVIDHFVNICAALCVGQ